MAEMVSYGLSYLSKISLQDEQQPMTPTGSPSHNRVLSNNSSIPPALVLIPLAAFTLLWKLGDGSLAAWDEAIYAQVSKEIAQGGNWLTLHWEYRPWFEKPPLLMWVTALLYRFFGVSEFCARAASSFSGIVLVFVTYAVGKLAYSKPVGLLSAVILLTCYHFLSFSRFGTMDVMLTLFIYLTLDAYLRLRDGNQKWWYMVWASCALAVMTKGAGGLVAPAILVLALIYERRFGDAMQSKHFWLGVTLALLIVTPWHMVMYVRYGRAFIDEYIGYHVIARSTRTLEGHQSTPLYYVGKLLDGFFPWCLLVPFAVMSGVRETLKGQSRALVFLVTSALVFGLYTLIPTRRPWYIVPLYPALAILIAALIVKFYRANRPRPIGRRIATFTCALFVVIGCFYSVASLYLNHKAEEPVARLARLAQTRSPNDRDSLVLFSESEPFPAQIPLFYSNRPIQQAYATVEPTGEDAKRYVHTENLADVVLNSTKRIILRKDDAIRLAADYEIQLVAETDSLVYAMIKHK